jgi:hypothetical protein
MKCLCAYHAPRFNKILNVVVLIELSALIFALVILWR